MSLKDQQTQALQRYKDFLRVAARPKLTTSAR